MPIPFINFLNVPDRENPIFKELGNLVQNYQQSRLSGQQAQLNDMDLAQKLHDLKNPPPPQPMSAVGKELADYNYLVQTTGGTNSPEVQEFLRFQKLLHPDQQGTYLQTGPNGELFYQQGGAPLSKFQEKSLEKIGQHALEANAKITSADTLYDYVQNNRELSKSVIGPSNRAKFWIGSPEEKAAYGIISSLGTQMVNDAANASSNFTDARQLMVLASKPDVDRDTYEVYLSKLSAYKYLTNLNAKRMEYAYELQEKGMNEVKARQEAQKAFPIDSAKIEALRQGLKPNQSENENKSSSTNNSLSELSDEEFEKMLSKKGLTGWKRR